jgi:hypothetical protein
MARFHLVMWKPRHVKVSDADLMPTFKEIRDDLIELLANNDISIEDIWNMD